MQLFYEEDILENRSDEIIGYYLRRVYEKNIVSRR